MKMGVMGAGAVGGYFGGLLAKSGVDVRFLVRPARAAQLQKEGFSVRSVHGDFSIDPVVTTSIADMEDVDVLLLAVKNYHLTNALPDLKALAKKGVVLLPLLNGVRHMDELMNAVDPGHLLGGSCYIEVTLDERGHVVQTSDIRDLVFGPLRGAQTVREDLPDLLLRLQDVFTNAGFPGLLHQEIMREMWKKYVFLCAFSGVTASTRAPIGVTASTPATRNLYQGMVEELLAVAKARQIGLTDHMVDVMMQRLDQIDPNMTSSLHRDLAKGLPLEVDSLQGALMCMLFSHLIEWARALQQSKHEWRVYKSMRFS
ncbi:hypothetical protein AYJ22_14165 [Ferroacidibacillus organovorans]|nr:hypothetical protein AYJ22_14165 [Ferroacidibacillus organovorans]